MLYAMPLVDWGVWSVFIKYFYTISTQKKCILLNILHSNNNLFRFNKKVVTPRLNLNRNSVLFKYVKAIHLFPLTSILCSLSLRGSQGQVTLALACEYTLMRWFHGDMRYYNLTNNSPGTSYPRLFNDEGSRIFNFKLLKSNMLKNVCFEALI